MRGVDNLSKSVARRHARMIVILEVALHLAFINYNIPNGSIGQLIKIFLYKLQYVYQLGTALSCPNHIEYHMFMPRVKLVLKFARLEVVDSNSAFVYADTNIFEA